MHCRSIRWLSVLAASTVGLGAARRSQRRRRPDLVTADAGAATVSVHLDTTAAGAVTPAFAAQQAFATGSSPSAVAVADVNGDGRRDLVASNSGSATVSVLVNSTTPGSATPTFAAQTTFGVQTDPVSVAAGDVNGDGRPDVAVANSGSGTTSVLLNTTASGGSSPAFSVAAGFAAGASPSGAVLADLDGDGRPDIVGAANGAGVVVLLDGTAPGATTPAPRTARRGSSAARRPSDPAPRRC